MNRRQMFAGLGALVGVGATLATAPPSMPPDEHSFKAWRVRWSGWRQLTNPLQLVEIGCWQARMSGEQRLMVATTLGHCDSYGELDIIDTCLRPGWPSPAMLTEAEKDTLKRRALALLYEHLT